MFFYQNKSFFENWKKKFSRGGLECIGVRFSFTFSKFGTSALGGLNPAQDYDIDRMREYKYYLTAIQIAGRWVTVMLLTVSNRALAEMIAKASSMCFLKCKQ